MDEINLLLGRLDPGLRPFLEGMDHPEIFADLQGVNDAERISSMLERQLHHPGTKAGQRLGDFWHLAFGQNGERLGQLDLRALRKFTKILAGGFDPADRAGIYRHLAGCCHI